MDVVGLVAETTNTRNSFITYFLAALAVGAIVWFLGFRFLFTQQCLSTSVHELGVGAKRVSRTVKELRRKTFHLAGLLIPCIHFFTLRYLPEVLNYQRATLVMGGVTFFYWVMELARITSPSFRVGFARAFQPILRPGEESGLTGVGFYLLGSFLCISLFPPLIAIASTLYLILGDLAAAIIGISFGRTKIHSTGGKSLEGFAACFCTCFSVGVVLFWGIPLVEYLCLAGAFAASLVELYAPFGVDDNLSIPVVSALALQAAAIRINSLCEDPEPLCKGLINNLGVI